MQGLDSPLVDATVKGFVSQAGANFDVLLTSYDGPFCSFASMGTTDLACYNVIVNAVKGQ